MQPPRIRFKPVQLKARHDGWTPNRQIRFIEELAATKSLTRACRSVGMSRASAYKLRDRPEATEFRLAWDAALRPNFENSPRSPRALVRLRRLERRRRARADASLSKVDEQDETNDPPPSPVMVKQSSSASETLQTYLAWLRAEEQRLGSAQGG